MLHVSDFSFECFGLERRIFSDKGQLEIDRNWNESIGGNYLQRQKECQGLFSATWKKWRLGKHTSNELIEQLFKSLVTIEERI